MKEPPTEEVPTSTNPFSGAARISPDHSVTQQPIVPVLLRANFKVILTYALLDSGSEISMIREDITKHLKLQGPV